jgi:hypothetical protein
MLKTLLTYAYVDESLAEYVPESPHSLPRCVHSPELAEFTHRSLLPVSMCRRKFCSGVPKLAFAKYSVSKLSSVCWTVFCRLRSASCATGLMTLRRWMSRPTTFGF